MFRNTFLSRKFLPYRFGVGMVVFNNFGKVWVGKRIDHNVKIDSIDLWQFPQGGIKIGESPLSAAFRELYEETGMYSLRIIFEMKNWLKYDFPENFIKNPICKKYRGQKQKWFAMHFLGKEKEIDIHSSEKEFYDWRWIDFKETPKMVIFFKRSVYMNLFETFNKIVPQFIQ